MLHSGNSHELDLRNIKNTRSFKIFGKWLVQASKQASIHKHVCNEVMVVWGSLRLAPIILSTDFESPLFPPLLFPTPISLPLAPQPRTQVQEDLGLKLRDTYTTDYRQHLSSYLSIPCLYN